MNLVDDYAHCFDACSGCDRVFWATDLDNDRRCKECSAPSPADEKTVP